MSKTLQSQATHGQLIFSPLTISCHLMVISTNSTAAQVYDSITGEFQPNRQLTPTVIVPIAMAMDPDNVIVNRRINNLLSTDSSELVWTVNNKPISEVWSQGVDYTIETESGDIRGTLYLYRNITTEEGAYELRFNGSFVDWRTGNVNEVHSDNIEVHTDSRTLSEFNLTVNPMHITYDPRYDNRLLYDYLTGMGVTGIDSLLTKNVGKHYLQTVKLTLTEGENVIDDLSGGDFSSYITYKGSSTPLVPGSSTSPELISFAYPNVVFDMRQVEMAEYTVHITKNSEDFISEDIILSRDTTMPSGRSTPKFASRLPRKMESYHNEAYIIDDSGNEIPYSELFYLITWYTRRVVIDGGSASYATPVMHMFGTTLDTLQERIGLGDTEDESKFDVYFDMQEHSIMHRLTDGNGNTYTDGANKLISSI